jgi:hypothetical protein
MRPISFVILLLAATAALAQPAGVDRTLRTIDFEERRLGNVEELPMHWLKLEGTGFPHYVNGRLSTDRAHSGQYSFRFDLNGGSLLYRYAAGQIRVYPGAHYRVECKVQTTVLPNARARLSAYFTDLDGRPIARSQKHSRLYAATREGEPWQTLNVELSADWKEAAYLVIELGLLQPARYQQTTLGKQALFSQDIRGSAWFDDVTVSQVPKVSISTDFPGNVIRGQREPKLHVLVNDRFTSDLAAQLFIRDATDAIVYQRSGAIEVDAAQSDRTGEHRVTIVLPPLRPGWYRASLSMVSQGQDLGEQSIDLIILPEESLPSRPDARFGVDATGLSLEGWQELPELLPVLGAGRVKLAIWSETTDIEDMESSAFDLLLERFQEVGVTPTAVLLAPPPRITKHLPNTSWLSLLRAKKETWQPALATLVAQHATHLDRWQLGADGSEAFVTSPPMRQLYQIVYKEFATLVEKPDLAMPWPAWYELEGELPATVALSVPPSVLPHQLPLYIEELRGREGHHLSLSLQLLDRERYGRNTQIRDLVQRIVFALASGAERIDVPLPFTVEKSGEDIVKRPQETLLILHTLLTTLGGATCHGRVPIDENIEAFLFERAGQGIIVMWDRGSDTHRRHLALELGQSPALMDLWGNVSALPRQTSGEHEGVQLEIGPMPVLLLDIDAQLAILRSSVAIDRPLLESSFQPHHRTLKFKNPYKTAISGSVRLRGPAGWTVSPPTMTFSLNPGETFERNISIEFPYNSYAGTKSLHADFNVQADRNVGFSVPIQLRLGLSDVGMQTMAVRDGDDVIVQQMITNYGDRPIDYTAFAIYPGQARQERLVTNLGPGKTTVKRYRFTVPPKASVTSIRVGVKELDGVRILNDEIPVQ